LRGSLAHHIGGRRSVILLPYRVELSGHEVYRGVIVLSSAPVPLLGMEFLRTARKALYLDREYVLLIDEADIEESRRAFSERR
jgi:hypothetical protein